MQIYRFVAVASAAVLMTVLPAESARAAKIRDLRSTDGQQFIQPLQQARIQLGSRAAKADIHARMLRLGPGVAIARQGSELWHGMRTYRYQQTFHGVPIFQYPIAVVEREDGEVLRVDGTVIDELDRDIPTMTTQITPVRALQLAEESWSMRLQPLAKYANEDVEEVVYLDSRHTGYLAYRVQFQATEPNRQTPSVPRIMVDARTGRILDAVETLVHADATGPGGNAKTGRIEYAPAPDHPEHVKERHGSGRGPVVEYRGYLEVTRTGKLCTLTNARTLTIDLNHLTAGSTPYSFQCPRNKDKPYNGGYSAVDDAHWATGVTYDTYVALLGQAPWPFKLAARVHFGWNYADAHYDNSLHSIVLGDGDANYFPFTCLDCVAHEIGHGFLYGRTSLGYGKQALAIAEAFGDMSGEVAEYHQYGSNDFQVGADVTKSGSSLRSMSAPASGGGIENVADYKDDLDAHDAAGIFDKAFYVLATTPGWSTSTAFQLFARAAQNQWGPYDDFRTAACGVISEASTEKLSVADVRDAFAKVGISCGVVAWDSTTAVGLYGAAKPTFADSDRTIISPREPSSGDFGFASGSTVDRSTGKRYVEFTVNTQGPATAYPYSGTICASLRDKQINIMGDAGMAGDFALCWLTDSDSGATAANEPWFRDGGVIWSNRGPLTSWRIKSGDTIGWAVDFDTGRIWFSLNGAWVSDPASGQGPQFDQSGLGGDQQLSGRTLQPHLYSDYQVLSLTLHGGDDMKYVPPVGFKRWTDPE